jgi:Bacterial regulatory proteins, gntR family
VATAGREDAEAITWHIDSLLSDSDLLPPALAATLRAYREHLLRHCAAQPWALPGNRARYAILAQAIERQIADGHWKPGQRLPFLLHLEKAYRENGKTVRHALFLLTVRGFLARDRLTYYVLPPGLDHADESVIRP